MDGETVSDNRRGVERLEAFSDGVFAIAITLLVLGIDVPDVSNEQLGTALSDLVPNVLAYFLGFAIIGLFWVHHHEFFTVVERHADRLLWTNLLFLSLIAAMPFTTGLIGEYGDSSTATVLFAANVALASLADVLSEATAVRAGVMDPDSEQRYRDFRKTELFTPAVFLLSIPVALVSVEAAQLSWIAILIAAVARSR